jgi:nucleotide-binding universal stress UspA family protein
MRVATFEGVKTPSPSESSPPKASERLDATREPWKRILVPTDFSTGAEHALGRMLLLPLAAAAAVHVVHVLPPGTPEKARARATANAQRELEEVAARARHTAAGSQLTLTSEVLSGEPFVEIIRKSRGFDAELVVLGRHGRRPVRDLFIGSTAERVIRKGDVPVLAVHHAPTHPYRRPLVAVGLEDTAPRVLDLALRALDPDVETIRVVHAYHVPYEGFVTPTTAASEKSEYRRAFRDEARAGLARLLSRYADTGLRWTTTIRAGDARTLVLTEAVRAQADLIALGTHGRSGVAHALLGSVAEWVISQADCDVLVSRPVRFAFEAP